MISDICEQCPKPCKYKNSPVKIIACDKLPKILCFHDVSYYPSEWCCPPNLFKETILKYPKAEIHFDDGRLGVMSHAMKILKELNRKATLFLVHDFLQDKAPESEKYSPFLNTADVKYILKSGLFEIGSHSSSHHSLIGLPLSFLFHELNFSKEYLEHTFNVKVTKFSFPFGRSNEVIFKVASKIYEKCYTLDSEFGIKRTTIIANTE